MSDKVKLGEGFGNIVSKAGDNDMRGVWVFKGKIKSRGSRYGGIVGIEILGGRHHITNCDRGRMGGFNSHCYVRSGSDREKRIVGHQ